MSTTYNSIGHKIGGVLLLCGLLCGCETKVEVAGPPAPPAPAASATPKPPVAPELPALTMPKIDGPTLGPPTEPPKFGADKPPQGITSVAPAGTPAANPEKRKLADDLTVVQSVIAKVMSIKPETVEQTKTLAQLKATNLDLADIREQIETRLKISLPMATLQKAAGTDMPYEVVDKLTVAKLAEVVNAQ